MSVRVVDIYRAASRFGKYPPLFTSTSVNNKLVIILFTSISSHLSSGLSESHQSVLDPDVSSSGNPLELSSWGLPPEVLRKYNELGITHMFEWQAECLRIGKVLTGGKLVFLWLSLLC